MNSSERLAKIRQGLGKPMHIMGHARGLNQLGVSHPIQHQFSVVLHQHLFVPVKKCLETYVQKRLLPAAAQVANIPTTAEPNHRAWISLASCSSIPARHRFSRDANKASRCGNSICPLPSLSQLRLAGHSRKRGKQRQCLAGRVAAHQRRRPTALDTGSEQCVVGTECHMSQEQV